MAICAWYASERSTPVTSRFWRIFLRRTGWRIFTCTASMHGTPHDRPESEGASATVMISAVQERFFRCYEIAARTIRSRHEPAQIGDGVGSSDGILEHVRAHAEEKVAPPAVCARLLDPRLK